MVAPPFDQYRELRELLVRSPDFLRRFRSTFLIYSRANFPDVPWPAFHSLQWDGLRMADRPAAWRHLGAMVFKLLKSERVYWRELDDPMVGEPRALRFFDLWLTETQIRFVAYRKRIERRHPSLSGLRVVDICGGYGGQLGELMRYHALGQAILVDVPECLILAKRYLQELLPAATIAYEPQEEATILLLRPDQLEALEHCDLAINTMGFQHLGRNDLECYCRWLYNADSIYVVNRNFVLDPGDIPLDAYPWPHGVRQVNDAPWLFGPHRERWYRSERQRTP